MGKAISRLERVIELESKQGYKDKAVVGGIGQFATFWVSRAREEAVGEADLALIEQIAETLSNYSRLPGSEARANAIDLLRKKIAAQIDRSKDSRLAKAGPARPDPPPKKKVKSKQDLSTPIAPEPEKIETPDPELFKRPVTDIKGVGPRIAERLEVLGIQTIDDLLYHFPYRYDDYTLLKPINQLVYGEMVTVIGTVWETRVRQVRNNKIVQSTITDGTGKIQATWFNQPWLVGKLRAGMQIVVSGKVDQFLGRPVFQNPDWEQLEMEPLRTRRIVPIYRLTSGISANKLREIVRRVLDNWGQRLPDPLPAEIRQRRGFYSLSKAIQQVHFPDSQETLHRARQRLIFDELFQLQLGMLGYRRDWQSVPGTPIPFDGPAIEQFIEQLPFSLTASQQRVIAEIGSDLANQIPMNRLLQGDVGSGKTVVAAAAMVLTSRAGFQTAIMAPTEILAEQHYQGLKKLLANLDIEIGLLKGSMPKSERKKVLAKLANGEIQVIAGTHALIQEGVEFSRLALAIIDEQHRFGVDQRQALREKGVGHHDNGKQPNPNLLVMSATPIPRSLALTLYGDLDLSIIDEMPPGRREIKTHWLRPSERERAYSFVRGQIDMGRQAFIICPLVEESDKIQAKAAVEEYERLKEQVFPDLKLGLLHGRMKGNEKESAMRQFYNGEADILVATSVIEVGIDIPNSTVMIIEGANRFGLAQLHQFRGRVGRGEHQSYCLLLADKVTGDAEERLTALEKSNDGFLLAEKDLEIRGPGEFLGRRQSGLPELHLASLTDMDMLEIGRQEAQSIYNDDPYLKKPDHEGLREKVSTLWLHAGDIS
jgi:ATP-dependent DNA helicase RecG